MALDAQLLIHETLQVVVSRSSSDLASFFDQSGLQIFLEEYWPFVQAQTTSGETRGQTLHLFFGDGEHLEIYGVRKQNMFMGTHTWCAAGSERMNVKNRDVQRTTSSYATTLFLWHQQSLPEFLF